MISIGYDTETCEGEPFSQQFYSKELKRSDIIRTSGATSLRDFLQYCNTLPRRTHDTHYVLWAHNLSFDLVSLFYSHQRVLYDTPEFDFEFCGWRCQGVFANVVFATFRKGKITVHLIDTYAYFKTSLAKLGALVCPDKPKLKMPDGLGTKVFALHDPDFEPYAMRDAEIAHDVGEVILDYHARYDVALSVSAPHFASRVFRRKYMRRDIPLPQRKVIYAALNSYHGGKNSLACVPGWHEDVNIADVVSAYPKAMIELPSFYDGGGYHEIVYHAGTKVRSVYDPGIYCVSGSVAKTPWAVLYDHSFKPISGSFQNIWTTGYELNAALRHGFIKLSACKGFFYSNEKECLLDKYSPPLKSYVEEFFNLKNTATNEIDRAFAKLLLNALYGKFIQSRKGLIDASYEYDVDSGKQILVKDIQAGGLFH
ncbi:MAG: DNA polymerase, partial [Acidiferrobacteraceae bacterium]